MRFTRVKETYCDGERRETGPDRRWIDQAALRPWHVCVLCVLVAVFRQEGTGRNFIMFLTNRILSVTYLEKRLKSETRESSRTRLRDTMMIGAQAELKSGT